MLHTERDEAIRRRTAEIPRSTFDQHAEVIALREKIAAHRAEQAKRTAEVPQISVGELYAHVDQLRAQKQEAAARVAEVAYQDLLKGDLTMARATKLRAEVTRLEGVIEDLVNAIIRYQKEAPQLWQPATTAERLALQAEKDLGTLLHSLARAQAVQEIAPGLSSRY